MTEWNSRRESGYYYGANYITEFLRNTHPDVSINDYFIQTILNHGCDYFPQKLNVNYRDGQLIFTERDNAYGKYATIDRVI